TRFAERFWRLRQILVDLVSCLGDGAAISGHPQRRQFLFRIRQPANGVFHERFSRSLIISASDLPPPSRSLLWISSSPIWGSRREFFAAVVKFPRILPSSSVNCISSAKLRRFLRVPASITIL